MKARSSKPTVNILSAEHAGFCFGVKRAIQLAIQTAESNTGNVYSLGPLIHNPQEVERLTSKGVKIASTPEEIQDGTVIIRSHGLPPDIINMLTAKGLKIMDATCPFVKYARDIALMLEERGYPLVIIGELNHPEIHSLVGFLKGPSWVISSVKEIAAIPEQERIGVIAQTTQSLSRFQEILVGLLPRAKELAVYNTICNATTKRQESTRRLAEQVDLMFVVGGKNSANTARLYEISQECGVESYLIETAEEIRPEWLKHKKNIGITAGASTPNWIIELVQEKLKVIINNR